jgi:hypothetical protein
MLSLQHLAFSWDPVGGDQQPFAKEILRQLARAMFIGRCNATTPVRMIYPVGHFKAPYRPNETMVTPS